MAAIKIKFLGVILLVAVFNSQALTLGRMRGAALVGQGLDVAIQVQLDSDDNRASLCFEADVFHADTRQDPAQVRVMVEPTQNAQTVNLRVLSASAVDEPVVTVYLRAGCAQKSSRRYVLLADVVSEPVALAAPPARPVPLLAPATAAAAPDQAAASFSAAARGVPAPSGSRVARKAGPVAGAKRPASATPVRKAARVKSVSPGAPSPAAIENSVAGRSTGQSRLKLDPVDVLSERVATLESSTASSPAELAARNALDAQRLQSLEASVKTLTALAAQNASGLMDMKARLQQAESERYSNPLVYGLAALLLASLAGIIYLLYLRGRRSGGTGGNSWSGSVNAPAAVGTGVTAPGFARQSGFSPLLAPGATRAANVPGQPPSQGVTPSSRPAPITQVDVSLVEMSESTFGRMMQSGATHSAVRKPSHADAAQNAPAASRRSINSEELFDIRQQAEFFVSLGQTDQAVRILENRISENGESSPLAYLDLLKIFHSLGLKADFRQVREEFSLLFNVRVPEFSSFKDEGKDLEEYSAVVAGITAVWGAPAVFARIEDCLFRDQSNTPRELFDLAAFRDLLLLHAVAQGAVSGPRSIPAPLAQPGFAARHPQVPQRVSRDAMPSTGASGSVGLAPSEPPLRVIGGVPELDIDLSDLHFSEPVPWAHRLASDNPGLKVTTGAGNLIDFDLPGTQTKIGPKSRK